MQVQDWDEEAEEDEAVAEEEELIRVQQEIERLWQEQESIMRSKAIAQRAEARRQYINKEQARLAELQCTIVILRQQEQRQEPPLTSFVNPTHAHIKIVLHISSK
jgi:metal-responsive CopG/Arc/MetJ family transcriptional regulator